MPFGSFLQIAGALPFSSFLTGGKKRSVKRSKKSRRKRVDKRTRKRVDKRTGRKRVSKRRVDKRTGRKRVSKRRVDKRTGRKVNRRGVSKRTRRKIAPKGKKCICDEKRSFKGDEPSPKGLGYCAHCTPLRVVMKGQDGNLWENQEYAKGKRWVLIRKDMRGGFIRGGT